MHWEVTPEPSDDAEREALVQAAQEAVDGDRRGDRQSAWWSSGLDELGGLDETTAMPWGRAARPEDGVLSRVRI